MTADCHTYAMACLLQPDLHVAQLDCINNLAVFALLLIF